MKIIHFVPYAPPERTGGVGEFVVGLHDALLSAGETSLIVTSGVRSSPGVERIARRPIAWFLKTALWVGRAARYDVVHCQGGEALPLLLLLTLVPRRPAILTTFHVSYAGVAQSHRPYAIEGRRFARGWRPWLYRTVVCTLHRLLDRATARLSDAVNAISRRTAEDVFGAHVDEGSVIYCGLPALVGADAASGPEATEILYVGAGGHRKRVRALPFVLRHVHRELPGVRMRIVGFDRAREPEVVELFAAQGVLEFVDFVGVKAAAELAPFYARAGVLVVPSAYEGLPLVVLEAMRSGLPVVATRVSGHPEAIVDGENGFLVDVDRPDQMAARCVEILRHRDLRRRLGETARQTVRERFSMDRQVSDYLALYRQLTDRIAS
jgi:glycosyltransferase involved in cell wall biosynthesis